MITNQNQWKQKVDMADVKRIGGLLRQKREDKRLTLDAVHAKTYLSLKYLAGVEDGELDQFPAEVYYLSTLRHYAGHLGLDSGALLESYRAKSVTVQQEQPALQDTRKTKSMKVYFAAVLLAGVVVFGLLIRQNVGSAHQDGVIAGPEQAVAVSSTAVAPAVTAQTAPAAAAQVISSQAAVSPLAGERKLRLSVKISETSWVKVLADNEILFEGTLLTGSEKEWSAQGRFYLVVGYAPGVHASLNGKPIDVTKGARQDINQLVLTGDDAKMEG